MRLMAESAPVAAKLPSLVGQTLGTGYRVLRELDAGGMGSVYEAQHLRLGYRVAIKVLADHLAHDRTALQRFHNEARALAALEHPNVVRVLDFDVTEQGQPFLVMELLRGETLGQLLADVGMLDVGTVETITAQIGAALIAAHSSGIVHRDLKPDNVFLVRGPGCELHVKVLDFGVSRLPSPGELRLTMVNEVVGTPEYMAPEQATAQRDGITNRVDQHALALIVYQMVSGVSPFVAARSVDSLLKVVREKPLPLDKLVPHVPSYLARAVERALSKDPEHRFPGIDSFLIAVLGQTAPHSTTKPRQPERAASIRPRPSSNAATAPLDVTRTVVTAVQKLHIADQTGNCAAALAEARAIMSLAALIEDADMQTVVQLARPLLEKAFEAYLEPLDRTIVVTEPIDAAHANLSASTAYLLSRIEGGISLENVLDVAGTPRLETLHTLLDLEQNGIVRFHRDSLLHLSGQAIELRTRRGAAG